VISIIVSSYQENFFQKFSSSLKKTIGVPYELIKIANNNKYSLTEAYNLGALESKFEILCFLHEDIEFNTEDWGKYVVDIFKNNSNIKLLGLAGSKIKSYLPTGWVSGISDFDRINILHVNKDGFESFSSKDKCLTPLESIKVIDGVFICTSRIVYDEFKFDESIKGFHLYDIDFSLRITQKYQAAILYDIEIIHSSKGGYNSEWMIANLEYHCREDKQYLFDRSGVILSKIRKSWYGALVGKKIDLKLRTQYIKIMGLDLKSAFYALFFLFPIFGKVFLFLLWGKQMFYKFVRVNK
jgi:hypothetical protein